MSVLRNDENLTTADIVNAENTRDTTTADQQRLTQRNLQPQQQQSAAVAERERVQGNDVDRMDQMDRVNRMDQVDLPDLEDKSDPRVTAARTLNPQDARTAEFQAQRSTDDRDLRPVQDAIRLPANTPAASAAARPTPPTGAQELSSAPLFPDDELHNFRTQWDHVQASFVDEPRQAVQQADSLVANVVKRIAEQFAEERGRLEKQWDRGDDVSTEDLRQGLRRYRAFFDRLLSF